MDAAFLRPLLFSLASALVLVPLCCRAARWLGLLDPPGPRKQQEQGVPLLGGVALLLALLCGLAAGGQLPPQGWWRIGAGALIVLLVGLLDDLRKRHGGLRARSKFLGQSLAVLILLSDRLSPVLGGRAGLAECISLLVLIFLLLSIINAQNAVDNMNGLSAGLALVTAGVCVAASPSSGSTGLGMMAAALAGSLAGFLPFNYPRAGAYLGDAGSYLAGFLVAVLALDLTTGFHSGRVTVLSGEDLPAALLLVSVPLFDLGFSVFHRLREGRPVSQGDARHLSHRLVAVGFRPAVAVLLLVAAQVLGCAVGWLLLESGFLLAMTGIALVLTLFLGGALLLIRAERKSRAAGQDH
ncbi:MAG: MraY family glycosyltransferase [Planctomycetota bacterium]